MCEQHLHTIRGTYIQSRPRTAPPSSIPIDSPSVLNVLVDHHGNDEGCQGVVPGDDEHYHKAEHGPQQGGGPVVVAEARAPVGGLQNGLDKCGQVHKHVAHEEEPGEGGWGWVRERGCRREGRVESGREGVGGRAGLRVGERV